MEATALKKHLKKVMSLTPYFIKDPKINLTILKLGFL
jgi:hypothetical protein